MKQSSKKLFFIFALLWLPICYSLGIFEHMPEKPMSVHQGAQCDRACIAQNYYYEGMRFFHPEVNEVIAGNGYVGCEFPLMNYAAAVCYKLFGYHDFWYRFLMFVVVSFGIFSAFRILYFYTSKIWLSLLCTGLFFFSPILVFYSANFVPDAASLGFMLVAWFYFFKDIHEPPDKKNRIFFCLFSAIAIAIKITSVIGIIVLGILLLLDKLKWLHKNKLCLITNKKYWWLTLTTSVLLAFSWYVYSDYLNHQYNSQYFMMSAPLAPDIAQFKEAFNIYWSNWPQETYLPLVLAAFGAMFILLPVTYKRGDRLLFWTTLFYGLGSLAFMAIMIMQFRYHDYYIITLLPSILFLITTWAYWLQNAGRQFWWIRISVVLILIVAVYESRKQTAKRETERFTFGNYWDQSFQQPEDYKNIDKLLSSKFGITRQSRVITAYDANPNNMLYFLNLRGYRISKDHPTDFVNWIYSNHRPTHLILTDTSYFTDHPINIAGHTLLYKNKGFGVYRIDYKSVEADSTAR
ncbi:MAG: glycosyltransferase family 39 protein [Bacteroidia bacterium]|nr:glycosyltransferase family 39 protein [Bacteroidia bacterium]